MLENHTKSYRFYGWEDADIKDVKGLTPRDYYDLLEGKPGAVDAYNGEYMIQYSWAELTNGELWKKYGE